MIWYRKKKVAGCIVALLIYWILRCKKYNIQYSAKVPKSDPIEVWEYISDFSHMKKLNPTITHFTIESESGNYKHWFYTVYYTEHLSQYPSVSNFAWADFEVKKISDEKFAIYSHHKTCFLTPLTCAHSDSELIIEPGEQNFESTYTESIVYECPAIFSSFCEREVLYQREQIKTNLQTIFKKREHRD